MKYNGVDPRSLHPGISIAKEIPPGTVTSQLETLSGADGEIIAGRTIQQGEYIVRVNIAGKYRAQAWEIRALLASWAMPTSEVALPLIPTHWPSVQYDAIFKEISPPEFTFGFTTVDVVFAIPRPIACDVEENYAYSTGDGEAVALKIGGTSYARPTIGLTLPEADGLELTVDDKTLLAMNGAFALNDFVFIYTNPPRVQMMTGGPLFDANERIDYTKTDFDELAKAFSPGEHTVAFSPGGRITVMWRDEWL